MAKSIAGSMVLLVPAGGCALRDNPDTEGPFSMSRWSEEEAHAWYRKAGVIRGCNYLPRSAVNSTEMWQAGTFDPATVEEELGRAADAGYNSIRVFLQYVVWKDDPDGMKERMARFLEIADGHGVSTMFVPFCDCSFSGKEPYLGPQDDPAPGVHNSGWVPSPGLARVTDRDVWPDLERYITDIVGAFARDRRVLIWDLYNEPGNSNLGEQSLPLVEAAFAWARSARPEQPLTVGVWSGDFRAGMSPRFMELSDVVSFHGYDSPEGVEAKIQACLEHDRPVVCTEWLHRQSGNTAAGILPVLARHRVGWYHWGLVAGRTQTYMPWGSKPGDPMPEVWQHDVFHPDGRPYDGEELGLLGKFTF